MSEDLIHKDGLVIEFREQVTLSNGVKYTGQWSGEMRHGLGSQIWPDGAKYDGYFVLD